MLRAAAVRVAVVSQGFQDAALSSDPAAASVGHAREFDPQGLEPTQLLLHQGELAAGEGVGVLAGTVGTVRKGEQGAHGVEREPELAGVTDEVEPGEMLRPIHAVPASGSRRRRQQPNLLVPADRLNLAMRAAAQVADAQG